MIFVLSTFYLTFFLFLYLCRVYAKMTLGLCTCTEKLYDKTVLITGGTKGIGYCIAKNLARRGAKVIITSRRLGDAEKAADKLRQETGNAKIVAKCLDYSTLKGVRVFAEDILKSESRLDVLINNAANPGYGYKFSTDGNLLSLQLNYLGTFLLTNLLLGLMKNTPKSRIINVSSCMYEYACYNSSDINRNNFPLYFDHIIYNNAKLFLIYMTLYMANRLKSFGTTVNCLHPGICVTKMSTVFTEGYIPFNAFTWKYILKPIFNFSGFKTEEEASQTTIHLAVSGRVENVTGAYFSDCSKRDLVFKIEPEEIKDIWMQSVKLVGLQPEEILL